MSRHMKTKSWTIGLDLGDRRHHVCVLNEPGDVVAEEAIVNTREVLTAFGARYPGATFVMETGTHSPWISRLLTALGHPVIVANARKLPCEQIQGRCWIGESIPQPACIRQRVC